jgi:hypothetical protein
MQGTKIYIHREEQVKYGSLYFNLHVFYIADGKAQHSGRSISVLSISLTYQGDSCAEH